MTIRCGPTTIPNEPTTGVAAKVTSLMRHERAFSHAAAMHGYGLEAMAGA